MGAGANAGEHTDGLELCRLLGGTPLGATNEAGQQKTMSSNVKVYGSFHFAESCTFDPNRNLILAMNAGNPQNVAQNDGFVSLINPDGSVHTAKWIGATRDGLEPHDENMAAVEHRDRVGNALEVKEVIETLQGPHQL